MDATLKSDRETRSSRRSRCVARVAIAWLATVLAVGLWQAYGTWLSGNGYFGNGLFGSGAGHGF